MARTIVICGHGPGISHAVAQRFAKEGFRVALLARNPERLAGAVKDFEAAGVSAKAFPVDLADTAAVTRAFADIRDTLGPVTVVHWNVYGGGTGDLATGALDELRRSIDLSTTNLFAAVQSALPSLRGQDGAAVLVTGGGLAYYDDKVDAMAVSWGAMGLAVAKASQHKAVGLLRQRLTGDGIYVGEVVVLGIVKGTAFDHGNGQLEAGDIAERFWSLYSARDVGSVNFPG